MKQTLITDRVKIANKWINKGYKISQVLDLVGLNQSTYYDRMNNDRGNNNKSNNPNGRPIPGYSYHFDGHKIPDQQIKEWLLKLVAGDGYPYIVN